MQGEKTTRLYEFAEFAVLHIYVTEEIRVQKRFHPHFYPLEKRISLL